LSKAQDVPTEREGAGREGGRKREREAKRDTEK
jgi:hypothetical protein